MSRALMKRRIIVILAATFAFMGPAGMALAAWMAPAGSGAGLANGYTLIAPGTGSVGTATLSTLSLSWAPSSGLPATGGYQILRGTHTGGPYTAVATGSCHGTISGTSCTDSGLSANTAYYYEVEAAVNAWVGPTDSEFSGTTDAADGSGTMTVGPTTAFAGSTSNNFTLTFTASAGAFGSGSSVTVATPSGWTAAQTTNSSNPGFVSATAGTCTPGAVAAAGGTITVPMACASGTSFAINYNTATAQSGTGTATFTTKTQEGQGGSTLTAISAQPTVTVNDVPSGQGTMTVSPSAVVVSATGQNLTFTFTAASGTFGSGSAVTVAVPTGAGLWSAPQTTSSSSAGFVSATAGTCTPGTVSVAGGTITVPMACASGTSFAINYTKAAAPTSTGTTTFTTQTREGLAGTLTNIGTQPVVTADASPTISSPSSSAVAKLKPNTTGQVITVAGTGFQSGAAISFSDSHYTATQVTFNTSGSLTVTVSDSFTTNGTNAADLTVTNPDGGHATSSGAVNNKG